MSDSNIKYKLKTHCHDGANILSAEATISHNPVNLKNIQQEFLEAVATLQKGIKQQKGYVGHIKVFVDCESTAFWISSTGKIPILKSKSTKNICNVPITVSTFYLTAIVFKMDSTALEQQVVCVLEDLFNTLSKSEVE